MIGFDRIEKHAKLVSRMADTLGIDLMEEVQHGNLAPVELRKRVFRCMECSCPEACGRWLDVHADGAKAAPSYCENGAMFEDLIARREG